MSEFFENQLKKIFAAKGSVNMGKRLEIDYVNVHKVKFGDTASLRDGVLTVNKEELINIASSDLFGNLDIRLVSPGEDCRILGIHDVMQPRCKAEHPEESYPGLWGKLAPASEGKTVALKGVVVSDIYYAKCNIKYYLDMGGPVPNTATSQDISIYALMPLPGRGSLMRAMRRR